MLELGLAVEGAYTKNSTNYTVNVNEHAVFTCTARVTALRELPKVRSSLMMMWHAHIWPYYTAHSAHAALLVTRYTAHTAPLVTNVLSNNQCAGGKYGGGEVSGLSRGGY